MQRKHFLNDHTLHAFIKERVIVLDIKHHPTTISEAILAYARETSSNAQYLMVENEQLEKKLQASRQEAEQL